MHSLHTHKESALTTHTQGECTHCTHTRRVHSLYSLMYMSMQCRDVHQMRVPMETNTKFSETQCNNQQVNSRCTYVPNSMFITGAILPHSHHRDPPHSQSPHTHSQPLTVPTGTLPTPHSPHRHTPTPSQSPQAHSHPLTVPTGTLPPPHSPHRHTPTPSQSPQAHSHPLIVPTGTLPPPHSPHRHTPTPS